MNRKGVGPGFGSVGADGQTRHGTEKATCITLRSVPFGEADLIVTFLSREFGRIDARAYGARSLRSAFRASCQPFCVSEVEFYVKNSWRTVKAAHVKSEFFGIQQDYRRYAAGCAILELTDLVFRDSPPEDAEGYFRLLAFTLRALDQSDAPQYILLYYFLRLTHLLGIFPVLNTCASCGGGLAGRYMWSAADGGFVCAACDARPDTAAEPLSAAEAACLRTFGRGLPDSSADRAFSPEVVRACMRRMLSFVEYHLGLRVRAMRAVR